MLKETNTTSDSPLGDTNLPSTANGYVPIVGMPPPTGDESESGTTSFTVTFSAIEKKKGPGAKGKSKTVAFIIAITSFTQQNLDADASWKVVELNEMPFNVSGIDLNVPELVDENEQYEIVVSLNNNYIGGFPVRLIIGFKMTDKDGLDPVGGTFTIKHPSSI